MTPSDTSPAMADAYYRLLAEMTPSERINIALALWEAIDRTQRAVLRRDSPEATEDEILYRLAVTRYGDELADRAYRK
jgi:hypothetical protein